jgi:hypothetical protein
LYGRDVLIAYCAFGFHAETKTIGHTGKIFLESKAQKVGLDLLCGSEDRLSYCRRVFLFPTKHRQFGATAELVAHGGPAVTRYSAWLCVSSSCYLEVQKNEFSKLGYENAAPIHLSKAPAVLVQPIDAANAYTLIEIPQRPELV